MLSKVKNIMKSIIRALSGVASQSGHMPGLWAGPQLGACEKQLIYVSLTHLCFSPSLSPSLPLSLKVNK